jgi:hypothetical protein
MRMDNSIAESEAPVEPPPKTAREPCPKAVLTKDPETPPVVVDHTIFAALGGTLKNHQRDDRRCVLLKKWLNITRPTMQQVHRANLSYRLRRQGLERMAPSIELRSGS